MACAPTASKPRVTRVQTPLPVQTRVEPLPSPVATALEPDLKADPVGLAIVEARSRFKRGEDLYKDGFLKRAKEEFDAAVDLLLETSSLYAKNPSGDREITDL